MSFLSSCWEYEGGDGGIRSLAFGAVRAVQILKYFCLFCLRGIFGVSTAPSARAVADERPTGRNGDNDQKLFLAAGDCSHQLPAAPCRL